MNGTRRARAALIYDFDGTLAPGTMQNGRFIPDIGMTAEDFWAEVDRTSSEHRMDGTLAYMFCMMEKAKQAGTPVRKDDLAAKSEAIRFYPGVHLWFDRMNQRAEGLGIDVEHYVISSGNAEIIEATPIAGEFTRIFASRFLFNPEGEAAWPAVAVNFTTKTQYLFRINKGALDWQDADALNRYQPHEERPVPFANMVYIGDGETDVPCFRLVHDLGGLAIAVHDCGNEETALPYLREGRVNATATADYRDGSRLDQQVAAHLELTAARWRMQEETKPRP